MHLLEGEVSSLQTKLEVRIAFVFVFTRLRVSQPGLIPHTLGSAPSACACALFVYQPSMNINSDL